MTKRINDEQRLEKSRKFSEEDIEGVTRNIPINNKDNAYNRECRDEQQYLMEKEDNKEQGEELTE